MVKRLIQYILSFFRKEVRQPVEMNAIVNDHVMKFPEDTGRFTDPYGH